MFIIFNKYLILNKPFVTILYFYQLLINPYFRSVFACKKCKCLIHKSIQILAYVRKFTYLSATKHIKQ